MPKLVRFRPIILFSIVALKMAISPVLAVQKCQINLVDKAYQEILFYYFQQDFYNALTHFEILQQACPNALDIVTNPGVDPQLLKGGISLAYGLDQQAAEIFNRLLSQKADAKTQVNAWLLLGKTFFDQQQYLLASQILANISLDDANQYLVEADKDEWIYLQSQLINWRQGTASKQDADNSYSVTQLSQGSIYRHYVAYNQGLAQLRAGHYQQAVNTLQQVELKPTNVLSDFIQGWWSSLNTEALAEREALRDRANLTLGYAHLQNQQPLKAIQAFDRVRLESLDTDSAMLGYGWAAAQRQEYQIALSAWQRLQAVPRTSEYVLESYLASAYAYEQAFAPTQAIDNLQTGLARFAKESDFLKDALNAINDSFFLDLASQEDWSVHTPAHLSAVMLGKEFQNQMQRLQQSLKLQRQFNQWQQRLDAFNLMLDERQQEAIVRAQALEDNDLLSQLDKYKLLRDQLIAQLDQAKNKPELLNQQQELAWQQRLAGAVDIHSGIIQQQQRLQQSPLSPTYAKRLKRLQGLMIWNASEAYAKRHWQAQKTLNQLAELIANTSAQQQNLQTRLNQPPEYSEQRSRIQALQQKLALQKQQNSVLQGAQLNSLNQLFTDNLQQQLTQLDSYKLQAQLAIVRLNDKAFRKAQADKQGAKQ